MSLFSLPDLQDLGPSVLDPGAGAPTLTRVQGTRSPALLTQVRSWCPQEPGVYGMLDRHGLLHYVGKAKNLRTRLLGYFRTKSRDRKAARIVGRTRTIVWETWPGELPALLRELELIRRWRPSWNVQGQPLRRRQTFVCLGRTPAPYIFLARTPPRSVLAHFGPVPAAMRCALAVRTLNDCFGLRDCPQSQEMIFPDQADLFPQERAPGCLRMELGACLGPCTGTCTRTTYMERVLQAQRFLAGGHDEPVRRLETDMHAAAAACQFERAAALRDKIDALTWLCQRLRRWEKDQAALSFIYPAWSATRKKVWYLIHASRLVTTTLVPHDQASARAAAELLRRVYVRQDHPGLLEQHEHYDGALLLAAWFRKYPAERKKTLSVDKALGKVQGGEG